MADAHRMIDDDSDDVLANIENMNKIEKAEVLQLEEPSDADYSRIFASESASNTDTDIIFSHPLIFLSVSGSEG